MKLRKFIGMAVAVLTLTLALCGCGDKKSKSESKSETKSDSESASSSNRTPGKFSPMVTKDAAVALGVNLDKRQAFKVVDAYLDQFCGLMQLREEDVDELKGLVSRSKKELFADAPRKLRKFLDERGLGDVDLRWAVISLEDLKIRYGVQVYGLSVAIAGGVDLEKLIPKDLVIRTVRDAPKAVSNTVVKSSTKMSQDDCKSLIDFVEERNRNIPSVITNDAVVFKEMMLEGEKVWRIEPQDESILPRREFEYAGIYPHVTSLDGQLLLAASSRNALVKLIRLYRQGKDAGVTLGDFSAKEGELLHLGVDNVGERVRQTMRRSDLQELAQVMPEADQAIRRLGALEADVKVLPDGMLQTSASLKAASEKDADIIRMLAKVGLMKVRSQWSEEPYMPREFVKMLDAVKIDGGDGEIKVQNVNPLLAFYHAASMNMFYVDINAVESNGGKLLEAINRVNEERAAKSLPPVWPRTRLRGGMTVPSDDVSARTYASAADYFNALFDMEHYGTPEWEPVVDGKLLSTLGKNAVVGKRIDAKGLDWCIAANVTEETWFSAPVLISANLNPVFVYEDQHQLLGPKSGAAKSMFGDKAYVLLRKGGYGTWKRIEWEKGQQYQYASNRRDRSDRGSPIEWLTPTGVVELEGGKAEAKENSKPYKSSR